MRDAPESLSVEERLVLSGLAEVMIPRHGGMPSAGDVGLCETPLDRAVTARPDLLPVLKIAAADCSGQAPRSAIETLVTGRPALLTGLIQAFAGAYYMLPAVRGRLGYDGQTRKPAD